MPATAGFRGWVSAGPDEWLGDDPARAAGVAALPAGALRRLRAAGRIRCEDVSAAGAGGPGRLWQHDVPADAVLPEAEAFIDLVAGRIGWDAATAPML